MIRKSSMDDEQPQPPMDEDAAPQGEAPQGEAGDEVGAEAVSPPQPDPQAQASEGVEESVVDEEPTGEESLMKELERLQGELARVRDQHLRLAADFENYRKRAGTDLMEAWGRAQADLVRGLLDGLDDLQRVSQYQSGDTTVDVLIEGVDLVERKLLRALTDAGLVVSNPEGEAFDPNTMEAVMRVPSGEDGADDMVHQVFQKGYFFKKQLVRPARVSVYKDDD